MKVKTSIKRLPAIALAAVVGLPALAGAVGNVFWVAVDDLNCCFRSPVVAASTGGRAGGGAEITPLGEELIRRFHAMERATRRAIGRDLDALDAKRAAGARDTRGGKDRTRER